jgi:hypothetical protein
METTHEPLHSNKLSLMYEHTTRLGEIIILFHAFIYSYGVNLWGYDVTNTELLCVEFLCIIII